MAGTAHAEVREGSGGLPEGSGWLGMPTRRSCRGREAHPEVHSEVREGPGGHT